MLSNNEKIEIINQHLRAIEYNIYNAELDKLEAEAVAEVDLQLLQIIESKLESFNAKKIILQEEKSKLG